MASEFSSFPITLEAVREVLQDVYDVPGLVELMADVRSRRVRVADVQTQSASPFAQSLLFGYVGQFIYEGDAPLAETLDAVDHAVAAGMVRYAGISNFVGWQTAQAATWQQAFPGRTPITSVQVEYSLLARRAEVEVVPALRALGMGLFPWSPIGRGVLTGKYRHRTPRGSRGAQDHFAWFVEPYLENRSRGVVEAVVRAADGLDLTPLQVALLWVRDAPGVTAPLLGARTSGQLAPALAVEDVELPPEIAVALDDVSGGPNTAR